MSEKDQTNQSTWVALIALWFMSTLFLGGVAAPYERSHLFLVSLILGALLWKLRKGPIGVPAPFPQPVRSSSLPLILFPALVLIQLIPLPAWILSWTAPFSFALTFGSLDSLGLAPKTTGYPISIDPSSTAQCLGNLLAFSLLLVLWYQVLRNLESRAKMVRVICGFAVAVSLFALVHRFSGSTKMFWFLDRGWNYFGPYVNVTHAGAFLATAGAMGITLFSRKEAQSSVERVGLALVVSLILLGLFFTGSRGGFLAFGLATAIHFYTNPRRDLKSRAYALLTVALALIFAFLWQATVFRRLSATYASLLSGGELRTLFWGYSLHFLRESPWFGIGLGAFSKASPIAVGDSLWLHPEHVENDYLELICSSGLVGAALIGVPLFYLARHVIRILSAPDVHSSTRAYAVGLVALAVDSLFVFNAPLPAHQILAAILIAGCLATRRYDLFSSPILRAGMYLLGALSFVMGGYWLVKSPEKAVPDVVEAVKRNPLDSDALYRAALKWTDEGDPSRGARAYALAKKLDPFSLDRRLAVTGSLGAAGDYPRALEATDALVQGPFPFTDVQRLSLRVQAAGYLVEANLDEEADKRLDTLDTFELKDWRVPLLRAFISPSRTHEFLKSWRLAEAQHVTPSAWDTYFLRLAQNRKGRIDPSAAAQLVAPLRPDAGIFLARILPVLPPDAPTIFISLDAGKPSPRLKANTSHTDANTLWEKPIDPKEIPESFVVRIKMAQTALDTYLLPVDLLAAPPELSFRVVVSSAKPLKEQLVVQANHKTYLTSDRPERRPDGRWNLYFRRAAEAVSKGARGPVRIQGVGFTALEKDGRYSVGPIEAFVEAAR